MNDNMHHELEMKKRGENRVWKDIESKTENPKKVFQTQLGQQLLFDDALNIVDVVREWIEVHSANVYRKNLQDFFVDDDILLSKIVETLLMLTASVSISKVPKAGQTKTRHKNVKVLNKKVLTGLTFDNAWRFLEVVIATSKYFETEKDFTVIKSKLKINLSYKCKLEEEIVTMLTNKAHSAFFPEPMTEAPLDWHISEGEIKGGYKSFQYDFVRLKSGKIDSKKYSQKIFDSINYIQKTSWKVSKTVVNAIRNDLKFPEKTSFIKSEYPDPEACRWDIDLENIDSATDVDSEEIEKERTHFRELLEIYNAEKRDFESAVGKYRAVILALNIADRYRDEENIYFPHSYDSRGRIYPIAVGLSPQGSDAIKAMIKYTKGEKLNTEGLSWCWAYLASLYGDDKLVFLERVKRGKELINTHYLEADEPYQFLAHQIELKKCLENPDYEFCERIHLDACNSGLK